MRKMVKRMRLRRSKISPGDLDFLRQLGDCRTGEIAKYEMAEMYVTSVDEIDRELEGSE